MLTQLIPLFSLFLSGMTENTATSTVVILSLVLLFLIVVLFVLYKKLNKDTNGDYTIENIIFKEGGVRDQVRGAALALETRLGVQLWPRSDTDEEGDEMQEIHDEEGLVEEGDRQGSDSEEDDQGEEEVEQSGRTKENGGDTSDENSSLEDSEGEEEETTLINQSKPEVKKGEEQEEKVGDGEGKGEASGGTGLLIDLKQFSGSAIWSEEEGGKGNEIDVTPL